MFKRAPRLDPPTLVRREIPVAGSNDPIAVWTDEALFDKVTALAKERKLKIATNDLVWPATMEQLRKAL